MSIKASKNSLAKLLADSGDDDLIAHNKTKAFPPKEIIEMPAEEADIKPETAVSAPELTVHPAPKTLPSIQIVTASEEQQSTPVPAAPGAKPYRSQGLTIYESDDDLVDGFIDYLRKKKLRIGRKKGFSLFARAGLRALEDLRVRNPIEFEDLLTRALLEQK